MSEPFYVAAGSLISPGGIFDRLPYCRTPNPIRAARKPSYSLPKTYKIVGELREIFEVGKHTPQPDFNFEPPGEEILTNGRMAKAIFLTWGSEVEDDERSGKLHKKDWLVAPVFPIAGLEKEIVRDSRTGDTIPMADAVRTGKSPRFFPLQSLPNEKSAGYYVDFRKICPLAANHFTAIPRAWRLSPKALNDLYHQMIWFFTRKRIFFGPISCSNCGYLIDLDITFEGQSVEPEKD
ncbi:MAG: hypothetical protein HYS38_04430 [Acidobacteria bacterium]|nr:hypothetical protein [Acidobacteriota bacterium]